IGGNSAGLAIQGDVVYDACPDQSAQSKDVLLDPFHVDVSLSRNFFNWRYLDRTITDTHFAQRDRMGRTLVFLARSLHDYRLRSVTALGVDEDTAVVVDRDGKGRVYGAGAAYLVLADHPGEVVERGKPLTYRGYKIWKFPAGSTIDLAHRPQDGYRLLDVTDGRVSTNPY
ncbi:MAG: cyanophycinase, partial [Thermoanaerobaculia bacterium]